MIDITPVSGATHYVDYICNAHRKHKSALLSTRFANIFRQHLDSFSLRSFIHLTHGIKQE
jgi:hypothetical protein